jgi:hypothetical protein
LERYCFVKEFSFLRSIRNARFAVRGPEKHFRRQ